jgi:hypothetical protein
MEGPIVRKAFGEEIEIYLCGGCKCHRYMHGTGIIYVYIDIRGQGG